MVDQLYLDITRVQKEILIQINGLDEFRMQALLHTKLIHLERKVWHEKHIKEKAFQQGNWALLYESRIKDFKGNFMTIWIGCYQIEIFHDNGFF